MKEKMPKGGSIYITCQEKIEKMKCARNIAVPTSRRRAMVRHIFLFWGKNGENK